MGRKKVVLKSVNSSLWFTDRYPPKILSYALTFTKRKRKKFRITGYALRAPVSLKHVLKSWNLYGKIVGTFDVSLLVVKICG